MMFFDILKSKAENINRKRFKKGEVIYHQGDQPSEIYFIDSGLVGLFHISESGKETFLRVFGNNSILGHRSFFAEEPYHGTSLTLAATELISIPKSECLKVCGNDTELLKKIINQLAIDLGKSELRLAGLLDKTALSRIAETLVFLKSKYPNQVWTRKQIAEYAGSTFETVTRLMSSLEEKKLIKKNGRDYSIIDEQKILLY